MISLTAASSHLGVSTLCRLSHIAPQYFTPSRLPRVRIEAEDDDCIKEDLAYARVLLLADHPTEKAGRCFRAALVYITPRKSTGMGDALEEGLEGTKTSDGRRGCLVRPDWRLEHGSPLVAVCGLGGAEAEARAVLGC